MRFAPNTMVPSGAEIANGRPAWGRDADGVDRYVTWLVASRRHPTPTLIGAPLVDGVSLAFKVRLPAYSRAIRVEGLATGQGVVRLSLAGDGYYVDVPVEGGANHSIEYAVPFATEAAWEPDAVVADGINRALNHAALSYPEVLSLSLTVIDDDTGTGRTLKLWAVNIRCENFDDQLT